MLELLFVWALSAAAVGFTAILAMLLLRHLFASLGRVVFFETKKADAAPGGSAA